jgi:hypothetical protein
MSAAQMNGVLELVGNNHVDPNKSVWLGKNLKKSLSVQHAYSAP